MHVYVYGSCFPMCGMVLTHTHHVRAGRKDAVKAAGGKEAFTTAARVFSTAPDLRDACLGLAARMDE